jgi:GNAT superfamily N-acetyltransferase
MQPSSPRVTRCAHEQVDALVASIASHFSPTWAMEATRAFAHGGLFVACDARQQCLGFAAHSGNRAWEATFGPIGVIEAQRKTGLGTALARAVFADLCARGRSACTVPWVDAATVRFYRKHFEVVYEHTRIEYRRELS